MSERGARVLLSAGLWVFLGAALDAQSLVHRWTGRGRLGVRGYGLFGYSLGGVSDVDGDGVADVIVGDLRIPQDDRNGRVHVYSGASGARLWRAIGPETAYAQDVEGPGDLDGDSIPDVLVTQVIRTFGSIEVRDGRTGFHQATIERDDYSYETSHAVGDIDRDGVVDFVVGGRLYEALKFRAIATLFSGATLQPIREWTAAQNTWFGWTARAAGDVDQDGTGDLWIGGPFQMLDGGNPGAVALYSVATGKLLRRIWGQNDWDGFGYALVVCGDLDGDAVEDVAVGAPYHPNLGAAGLVDVISGATGALLYRRGGDVDGARLGWSLALADDLDGDGLGELLAGAPHAGSPPLETSGRVDAFSPSTGEEFFSIAGRGADDRLGSSLAALGDLDGDAWNELAAAAPYRGVPPSQDLQGRVDVYTPVPLKRP